MEKGIKKTVEFKSKQIPEITLESLTNEERDKI